MELERFWRGYKVQKNKQNRNNNICFHENLPIWRIFVLFEKIVLEWLMGLFVDVLIMQNKNICFVFNSMFVQNFQIVMKSGISKAEIIASLALFIVVVVIVMKRFILLIEKYSSRLIKVCLFQKATKTFFKHSKWVQTTTQAAIFSESLEQLRK